MSIRKFNKIITTDSISQPKPPVCAICKERVPGVAYKYSHNGDLVCEPCSGDTSGLIRVVTDHPD